MESAKVMGNLGTVFANLGEYSKSLELLKKSKKIYEATHGRDSIVNAEILINLIKVYHQLGEYNQAHSHA
jgi:tetratricopeptide (TPR) repeat protein